MSYINAAPTYGATTVPVQQAIVQPQVVAQPVLNTQPVVSATGHISPFANHGGYFPPPATGTSSRQNVAPPVCDPYAVSYVHGHPSYIPREPIHPSEQGMYLEQQYLLQQQQQGIAFGQPRDAWEYEMQKKVARDQRSYYNKREPGSLFGWDPRDPPPPRRDFPSSGTKVVNKGPIKSIE